MNEKTNQSKRTTPNPSSLIECACFPPDKCENKDHCFTDYGVSCMFQIVVS